MALNDVAHQPDEALNTDQGQRETRPPIPYERFKEVNDAKKELEARLAKLERAQAEGETQQLAEQQKWKEAYEKAKTELDELRPIKSQVDEIRAALQETVEAEIATLPEDMRGLVPQFPDPRDTLKWLTANKAKLVRPLAPGTDPGIRGDGGQNVKLTPEEEYVIKKTGIARDKYIARKQQLSGG